MVLVGSLALTLGGTPSGATPSQNDHEDETPTPDSGNPGGLDFTAGAGVTRPTLVTSVATAATAPAQTMAPFEYVVVEGDTISDIAGRYGLSTASVLALNGLSWKSLIFPGQVLSLNASATPSVPAEVPLTRYTVAAGDTVSEIAARHALDTGAVLSANGLGRDSVIYPGQSIVIPQITSPAPVIAVAPAESGPVAPVTPLGSSIALTEDMLANATQIVRIGRELEISDHGIVIALAAAMQESSLRNLEDGHLDSLGLFQQRPSTGWGSAAQIHDTDYAIRAFFTGVHTEQVTVRGLLDIRDWQSLSVAEAAQAVQISAHPDAYGRWEADAWSWLAVIG